MKEKFKEKSCRVPGYRNTITAKWGKPQQRLLIGVPMTGTLRSEWVLARYGQVIPCNWSSNDYIQWIDQNSPLRFMVADARNVIVRDFMKTQCEWLLFIDHDVVLPPLFLVAINEHIIDHDVPMFSGLYFTKSVPSEPLVYRGRGNGYYNHWKIGDRVWVDGIPMGCTVIHRSIIEALWKESKEYNAAGQMVRQVFETPTRVFYDPETHSFNTQSGTEDLELCSRIMTNGIFKKAGWPEFQRRKWPFLIETKLFCWHIDENGTKYPAMNEHLPYVKKKVKQEVKPWCEELMSS